MKLVSACLAGFPCRYDGRNLNRNAFVEFLVQKGEAIPFCPEQMGGLPTPRQPAELRGGAGDEVLDGAARVVNRAGQDVTDAYLRGAREALCACRRFGVTSAILKARSPSCGCGAVYDGTFSHTLRPGDGVTAALLRRNGIPVTTEEEFQ